MKAEHEILSLLKEHRTVGSAPIRELEWLAAHGSLQTIEAGTMYTTQTEPVEELLLIFSGSVCFYGGDQTGHRHKIMEWRGGDVTGLLPYSRMTKAPGISIVEERSEILSIRKEHFPELITECHTITAALVHVMLDRARQFTWSDLHDEKMASLGKLAAGLAHELNNPASSVSRNAKLLSERLTETSEAARGLGAAGLVESQHHAVNHLAEVCLASTVMDTLAPLELSDREDGMAAWLEQHGADASCAQALAETPVSIAALNELASAVSGPQLAAVLRWIGMECQTRRLATDLEKAATRIYELVSAVKGFTHMDRSAVQEQLDISRGLTDTIAVLRSKAREKSITLNVTLEPELPQVYGFGGELNQVWSNLIDNACDAVDRGGTISIIAKSGSDGVVVSVADSGPGVPPEIQSRIFDPFFTTKPVGQGTGLGLDIARRIVSRHNGEIELVESKPGRTEFRVSLPSISHAGDHVTPAENRSKEDGDSR